MAYPLAQPDPAAVFGRRVLAFLIDVILIAVPITIIATADFEYLTTETLESRGTSGEDFCETLNDRGDMCIPLTDVEGVEAAYFSEGWSSTTQAAFWLLPIAYLVVLQGFTGWTIGKLICGVRTVQEDGRATRLREGTGALGPLDRAIRGAPVVCLVPYLCRSSGGRIVRIVRMPHGQFPASNSPSRNRHVSSIQNAWRTRSARRRRTTRAP